MDKNFFYVVFYCGNVAVLLACIYIIVRFFRKGWIKLNFNTMLECKFKNWLKKQKRILSIVANIGMIYCLGAIPDTIVPAIKDIPHAMNDDLIYLEGKVTNTSMPGSTKMDIHNLFIVEEESGKEINLHIYGSGEIKKGTIVQVEYLPHSLEGVLLGRDRN